jgi:hypothetical protein
MRIKHFILIYSVSEEFLFYVESLYTSVTLDELSRVT